MRIGIDGHVLGKNIGGVERYVEKVVELVPGRLPQHEFIVFIARAAEARFAGDRRCNVTFVSLPISDPLLQRSLIMPWAIRRYRLDILQVQRIAPWASGACRIALTVHDIIPLKYPRDYPGFRNGLIRLLTPGSLRRADLILTPTQSVCDDISRTYPEITAPLRPFYLGADGGQFVHRGARPDRQTLARHGITGPFIFSPGAIEARKNLDVVIKAVARLDVGIRPMLLLSGSVRDGAYYNRLQQLADELGVAAFVRHLGFLSGDDLVDLYGRAELCIAASLDEGFNLLPLEAMACGAPVVCSDIPVHRELFEGGVQFFNGDDPAGLSTLLSLNLTGKTDKRAFDSGSLACLTRLSWDAMAEHMALYLDELSSRQAL